MSEEERVVDDWADWPGPDDDPHPPPRPVPAGRGGPQRIPRPRSARLGGPPPWAAVDPGKRRLTAGDLQSVFASLGPAQLSEREKDGSIRRPSAVLAPIYDEAGEGHILLTRRTMQLRFHAGEISFPGGRVEPGETPVMGACREAQEEVNLDPGSVDIIGELDHLSTVSSDSFIVPYIGVLPGRPLVVPNPAEVDEVLFVPLAELADPAIYREESWRFPDGVERSIHFFELEGDTLWGATAAMLRQLLGIATGTLGRGDMGHP